MAEDGNPRLERALEVAEPRRRDALRRILTAAYAAPVVASFSLAQTAEARVLPDICMAANMTHTGPHVLYVGKVKCKGFSADAVGQQRIDRKFDVEVRLGTGGLNGLDLGAIDGGPVTMIQQYPNPLGVECIDVGGDREEVRGFRATVCDGTYYHETGQWKLSNDRLGVPRLKGKSWVTMRVDGPPFVNYSLECDYDLALGLEPG